MINKIKQKYLNLVESLDRIISGGVAKQLSALLVVLFVILTINLIFVRAILFFVNNQAEYKEDSPTAQVAYIASNNQDDDSDSLMCNNDFWSATRGSILYFLGLSSVHSERSQSPLIQVYVFVISGLGMLFFNGLLISTFCNVLERRVSRIQTGEIVYKNIKDHCIIIGYGEISFCVIEDFLKSFYIENYNANEADELPNDFDLFSDESIKNIVFKYLPKIILFTNQDIAYVRSKIYSFLPKIFESRILFYLGDIESVEHIKKLNIDKAKEICVLGECNEYGRDTKNLEVVRIISDLRQQNPEILPVYVQFDRLTSYSIIQKLSLPLNYLSSKNSDIKNIYFRPFNFFENWARSLWGFTGELNRQYDSLDFEKVENDKYVHLVIIAFNRMGRALLFEALRLCHYPNYDEQTGRNKTKITVIDKNMHSLELPFKAEYPYLTQIQDIEIDYVNAHFEDEYVRNLITQASLDPNQLLTVALCMQDPDSSLSSALSLPSDAYYNIINNKVKYSNTRILVRQDIHYGIGNAITSNKDKYRNVKSFGMLSKGMSRALVADDLPMLVNAHYMVKYRNIKKENSKIKSILDDYNNYAENKKSPNLFLNNLLESKSSVKDFNFLMEIAKRLWCNTSENFRFSNRYQVDMYYTYAFRYPNNKALVQMEHLRWCAERSVIGYRDMSNEDLRDDFCTLHNLIVPFKDLSQKQKNNKEIEKDEDVVYNIKILFEIFDIKF